MTDKTLDEYAEAVDEAADVFRRPEDWTGDELAMHHRATVAAYEAERAARVALEARVRELEAERDAAVAATAEWRQRMVEAEVRAETQELEARAEKAEADLAETRAQLARLRDAAEGLLGLFDADSDEDPARADVDSGLADLRAALSTPGPTLAEIRRAARVPAETQLARLREAVLRFKSVVVIENTPRGVAAATALKSVLDDLEAGR